MIRILQAGTSTSSHHTLAPGLWACAILLALTACHHSAQHGAASSETPWAPSLPDGLRWNMTPQEVKQAIKAPLLGEKQHGPIDAVVFGPGTLDGLRYDEIQIMFCSGIGMLNGLKLIEPGHGYQEWKDRQTQLASRYGRPTAVMQPKESGSTPPDDDVAGHLESIWGYGDSGLTAPPAPGAPPPNRAAMKGVLDLSLSKQMLKHKEQIILMTGWGNLKTMKECGPPPAP